MKILSVIIPTIFVGFSRIDYKDDKQSKFALALRKSWPLFIIYGVLFLNIMEATVKDLSLGNYFNTFVDCYFV